MKFFSALGSLLAAVTHGLVAIISVSIITFVVIVVQSCSDVIGVTSNVRYDSVTKQEQQVDEVFKDNNVSF